MIKHGYLAIVFTLVIAVFIGIIVLRIPHVKFEASVLSLLPDNEKSLVSPIIEKHFTQNLDSQLVFIVKSPSVKAAESFYDALANSPYIQNVNGRISDTGKEAFNQYIYENKTALLTEDLREKLSSDKYPNTVLYKVFSGLSGTGSKEIIYDPLLLTRELALSLSKDSPFTVKNNFLCIKNKPDNLKESDTEYYFINAKLKTSGFEISQGSSFVNFIDNEIDRIENEFEKTVILKRGTCFYSDYAAKLSARDISVLGSSTLVLVFVLIYFTFRSLTPVILTMLSVTCGLIGAAAFTLLFFDTVSLILMGMCMCVIGIVCDYTIYYLTYRMAFNQESPTATVKRMAKPLLFAVGTDIVAYLIILITPVTALKQLSLFSAAALTFSCLFVILIEPYLLSDRLLKNRLFTIKDLSHIKLKYFSMYLSFIKRKAVIVTVLAAVAVTTVTGLSFYRTGDDPKTLQKLPEILQSQDNEIAALTNQNNSFVTVIVQANTQRELLQRYDELKEILYKAKKDGIITNYKAVPFNSDTVQQTDYKLVKKQLDSLKALYQDKNIGLDIKDYAFKENSFDDFLNSELGSAYKDFYVHDDSLYALTVLIDKVNSTRSLNSRLMVLDSTYLSDRHKDITSIFERMRRLLYYVVMTFSAVIVISSVLRLGFKTGIISGSMNVLAVLFSMAVLFLSSYSVNIFNLMALILVLGIGVNYSVFFTNTSKSQRELSLLAITCALATTVLSLGILVFSSTDAISGFGITLLSGILISFVMATMLPFIKDQNS